MGLDMYLQKWTYVKNWDHMLPEERTTVVVMRDGKPLTEIDPEKIEYIIEEVGYWRKANAIHQWFVEHVQEGTDDCGHYYVDRDKLQELLVTVREVLLSCELVDGKVCVGRDLQGDIFEEGKVLRDTQVAEELLPTQSGFFFGHIDYDEYYVKTLERTKTILEEALKSTSGDYYYHSSW